MKQITVIKHVAFENLGIFEPVLASQGYHINYLQAGIDDLASIQKADALFVLGGPIGVYEEDQYPFLTEELSQIETYIGQQKPVMGICLGAQLIARILGANVYKGDNGKEIGWAPIIMTQNAANSALAPLGNECSVLHWHGDTFDLPHGAVHLASSDLYPNQAYAVGNNVLGLQFHVEAAPNRIEEWLIGHTCELGGAGIEPSKIREDTKKYAGFLEDKAKDILDQWFKNI